MNLLPAQFVGKLFKHAVRGTTYQICGTATLQINHPKWDNVELVIYKDMDNEKKWARPSQEFFDGRPKTLVLGLAPIYPNILENTHLLLELHHYGSNVFHPVSDLVGATHSRVELEQDKNENGIVYRFRLNLVCGDQLHTYHKITNDEIALYGLDVPTVFLNLMDNFFHLGISEKKNSTLNSNSNSSVVCPSCIQIDEFEIVSSQANQENGENQV